VIKIRKFKNLEIEMIRSGITRKDIAKALNITYTTISYKINNTKPFYRDEMFKIKELLKTNLSLDELFLIDENYNEKEVKNGRL
jgi:transcriptional regulator with XRE-family HTH domain